MVAKKSSLHNHLLQFRRMTKDDINDVMLIEISSYTHPWTAGIFSDCIRVGYGCWVVTDESEEVIGYAILSYAVGEAHVLNICVSKSHRSQGVGRQVMLFLIERATQLGADTLLLEVRPSNVHAIQLYSQLGFNEVGVRRHYYNTADGKEDAIIMAYTIMQQDEE